MSKVNALVSLSKTYLKSQPMEVDWDLHAVVRPFCSTAATTTTAGTTFSLSKNENIIGFDFFPDPFRTRNDNNIEQILNVLNNPLEFPKLHKPPLSLQSLPISPISVIGGLQDPPPNYYQQHNQQKQQSYGVSRCTTSNAKSTRSKKRKNQMKKVCQVPAEKLSSDVWCWRKYGQKPIKGSPYPRGYYRCSTSKGCLARKQVERNRSDPDMFILTYTGDHSHPVPTHRNSLAGSTRTKPTTSGNNDVTKTKPTSSPAVSPATEKTEDNDTEDDTFDSIIDDDFFEGLDELVSPVTGDKFPVIPWLSMLAGGS